jgi:BirA family transcriptional regulator, biotin operon repressor / biotin---[acetyl-CoA-carboxylase] ligase
MRTDALNALPSPNEMRAALASALPEFVKTDWVEQTASTNQDLMTQIHTNLDESDLPQLKGAHHQTAGRGRAGRRWEDATGQALMFSCAFELGPVSALLAGLGPVIGIVSCETLRACWPTHADRLTMKWPNDLMLDNGKLAGILIESQVRKGRVKLVIGMGLNMTVPTGLSARLGREVAGLEQLTLKDFDPTHLVAQLARAWHQTVITSSKTGSIAAYVQRLMPMDYLYGREVDIRDGDRIALSGKAMGINAEGALLVQPTANQSLMAVTVGDVSVRLSTAPSP